MRLDKTALIAAVVFVVVLLATLYPPYAITQGQSTALGSITAPNRQDSADKMVNMCQLLEFVVKGGLHCRSNVMQPALTMDLARVANNGTKFLLKKGEWEMAGKGISFSATGEPKSGTTWLANIVVKLAVHLCGCSTNAWCRMGKIKVKPHKPADMTTFEMVNATDGSLFLHFKGNLKHEIPGFDIAKEHGCSRGGRTHRRGFEARAPCQSNKPPTRERLRRCLPDASPQCIQHMPFLDLAVRRMVVVVRDPRNVVISEHRMRTEVYHRDVIDELNVFVYQRLEIIAAWMHQRWVWHTTALDSISHVLFYEDLKADHHLLVALAGFMGLDCSSKQAMEIWQSDKNGSPRGDYTTYGLPVETLEWMNSTLSSILPEPMLKRWGLTATKHV